ncbi:MAG TPA: ECF-type sigma factor [Bryobacteraceae bacterium]|jgi:RNA polymerase sigma factor (TIGR02999 family)|nr:ECF-type sigma factor [Bryobacteraceae bacterium]
MSERSLHWVEGWESGQPARTPEERRRLDILFSLTYEELRRLAAVIRRGDPCMTLNTTALVNEAWLKLAGSPGFSPVSRLHFKRIAARAMRQLLIEAARRRSAGKRGSGALPIALDDIAGDVAGDAEELLALDSALEELAQVNPRQAQMVEARFFGGLDAAETAAALEVSEATLQRDWRAARAWLSGRLRHSL